MPFFTYLSCAPASQLHALCLNDWWGQCLKPGLCLDGRPSVSRVGLGVPPCDRGPGVLDAASCPGEHWPGPGGACSSCCFSSCTPIPSVQPPQGAGPEDQTMPRASGLAIQRNVKFNINANTHRNRIWVQRRTNARIIRSLGPAAPGGLQWRPDQPVTGSALTCQGWGFPAAYGGNPGPGDGGGRRQTSEALTQLSVGAGG